jgi:hypothetical protein
MIQDIPYLAETVAAAEPMVPGGWLTGFVVAVITAVGTLLGYKRGRTAKTEVEPNPLNVSMVAELATKDEMRSLEARLMCELKKLEQAMDGERSVARTAQGNLHARIDRVAENLAATTATMNQINASLNRVLDILLHRDQQQHQGAKPNRRETN